MEWNEMEWNGMKWNGMEWNGMKTSNCSGIRIRWSWHADSFMI
jgi:hypothetical protein